MAWLNSAYVTFEKRYKLKKIVFNDISVSFEPLLLFWLISHCFDKGEYLSDDRRVQWILVCELNTKIQKNKLVNVLFILYCQVKRQFHLLLNLFALFRQHLEVLLVIRVLVFNVALYLLDVKINWLRKSNLSFSIISWLSESYRLIENVVSVVLKFLVYRRIVFLFCFYLIIQFLYIWLFLFSCRYQKRLIVWLMLRNLISRFRKRLFIKLSYSAFSKFILMNWFWTLWFFSFSLLFRDFFLSSLLFIVTMEIFLAKTFHHLILFFAITSFLIATVNELLGKVKTSPDLMSCMHNWLDFVVNPFGYLLLLFAMVHLIVYLLLFQFF